MQKLQQHVVAYKERTNAKLRMIEELVDLAVQKMNSRSKARQDEFVNPFGRLKKSGDTKDSLRHLQLILPKYGEGKIVEDWLQDCELYFDIYGVPENKKVVVAGMHLEGTPKSWYQIITMGRIALTWQEFCTQLSARFGVRESEPIYEKFKNLRQEQYCKQFALCMGQLKVKMPQLLEEYFVECFISGLQEDVKQVLKLLSPSSIEGAFKRARYCAQGNTSLQAKKNTGRSTGLLEKNVGIKGELSQMQEVITLSSGPVLSHKDDRGLCEQQDSPNGTTAKNVGKSESTLTAIKSEERIDEGQEGIQELLPSMGVSIHAIEGAYNNRTISLTGKIGSKELSILVDDGSTHSLLDEQTASKLKCEFEGAQISECLEVDEHQLVVCGIGNMAEEWPNLTGSPNRQQKREVFKDLAHAALEIYTGKPIYDEGPVYDEEQGEGQGCWPDHEFLLAALRGDNSNSPDLLQSELCISEGLEADLKNKPNKVLKDGDKPKLVDHKGEERQGVVEEKSPIILTNRREELIEDVPCGNSPTAAANSSGLGKKSSHLNKRNMIIFDPGGLVQEDHSEGINMMFKSMISIKEVKLEKVALINSAGGQPGQWQGHPKFVIHIEISEGIQGRQGKPGRVSRLEDHEASRKRNTIIIFDPGGNTLVSMRLKLLRKHLKFYMLSSLQVCSKMNLIQEKEDWKCKIHEDMDEF